MQPRVLSLIAILLCVPMIGLPPLIGIFVEIGILHVFVKTSKSQTDCMHVFLSLHKPSIIFSVTIAICIPIYIVLSRPLPQHHFLNYLVAVICQFIIANYGNLLLWVYLNRKKFEHAESDVKRPKLGIGS